jgi:hypothetical protein
LSLPATVREPRSPCPVCRPSGTLLPSLPRVDAKGNGRRNGRPQNRNRDGCSGCAEADQIDRLGLAPCGGLTSIDAVGTAIIGLCCTADSCGGELVGAARQVAIPARQRSPFGSFPRSWRPFAGTRGTSPRRGAHPACEEVVSDKTHRTIATSSLWLYSSIFLPAETGGRWSRSGATGGAVSWPDAMSRSSTELSSAAGAWSSAATASLRPGTSEPRPTRVSQLAIRPRLAGDSGDGWGVDTLVRWVDDCAAPGFERQQCACTDTTSPARRSTRSGCCLTNCDVRIVTPQQRIRDRLEERDDCRSMRLCSIPASP